MRMEMINGQRVKPLQEMKEDMFYRCNKVTWDYKSDGIKQLKYDLVNIEEINPKAKMINVKLDGRKRRTK